MYVSLEAINAIENFMNAEVSFETEESCLAQVVYIENWSKKNV